MTPATMMVPKARCQPFSPPPKSATALAAITMRPAAGPFIVNLEPAKKETTIPPIIAEIRPISGGKSDALAIPKLRGRASKETISPEMISEL